MGLQPDAWRMPPDLPHYLFLDEFPEMTEVREAYTADPVLLERVDTMLGTAFSRSRTNFSWIIAQHVIEPLVNATRSYTFADPVFDGIYREFETRFRAKHLSMIEFRAFNGFESTEDRLWLPDGLVLQRMTDTQLSTAINSNAVPRMDGGAVNSARVHRYDQWALMTTHEFPVAAGDQQVATPQPLAFPMLDEPAERLVTALRLVCGGSVVATRSMYEQADTEFPFVSGGSAVLSAFNGADNDRPTILQSDAVDTVRGTYTVLGLPQVMADESLQVAIRRLVFAGSRNLDTDRLLDLMTCAEALFIKRANKDIDAKGAPVAQAAADLLATDPELNTDHTHVGRFMRMAYRARNAEVHGDVRPRPSLHQLSGEHTTSLTHVASDAERIMRRAILTTLREYLPC